MYGDLPKVIQPRIISSIWIRLFLLSLSFLSLQHPSASGVGRGSAEGRLFKLSLRRYIGFFRKRRVGLAQGQGMDKGTEVRPSRGHWLFASIASTSRWRGT